MCKKILNKTIILLQKPLPITQHENGLAHVSSNEFQTNVFILFITFINAFVNFFFLPQVLWVTIKTHFGSYYDISPRLSYVSHYPQANKLLQTISFKDLRMA